jgi:hypothetical protein
LLGTWSAEESGEKKREEKRTQLTVGLDKKTNKLCERDK